MRRARNMSYRLRAYVGIGLTALFLLSIVGYVLVKGVAHLDPEFLFTMGTTEGSSILPAVITTLYMIGLTLLLAVPVGVGSAIYLHEYAKPGSRLVKIVRLTTESLSGIPSILYGLFGFLCFVMVLHWSWSILAGSCTLAIMVLPIVMRSTAEALITVPEAYREASFALGAGKLRTVSKVVLPGAVPGILAAVILSVGRIVGESAALVLTAGTVVKIPKGLFSSASTLSVFMYTLVSEGLDFGKAYATAIVLMLVVILVNALSNWSAGLLKRRVRYE